MNNRRMAACLCLLTLSRLHEFYVMTYFMPKQIAISQNWTIHIFCGVHVFIMAIVCFTLMSTEIPIKFVIYHAAFFAVIEHEANCRIMIYADLCWHQQKFLPKL